MRERITKARGVESMMTYNLGSLLMEFFHLYGNVFNFTDVGISITKGGSYFVKAVKEGDWINANRCAIVSVSKNHLFTCL